MDVDFIAHVTDDGKTHSVTIFDLNSRKKEFITDDNKLVIFSVIDVETKRFYDYKDSIADMMEKNKANDEVVSIEVIAHESNGKTTLHRYYSLRGHLLDFVLQGKAVKAAFFSR